MIIDSVIKHFGTQAKAANEIGVRQQTVSDWLHGKIKPSAKNAIMIENATGGVVTRAEVRSDIFGV